MYRLSAPPGLMEQGWDAQYTEHDDKYQYLKVQYSTIDRGAEQVLKYGAYREEILRCPIALLPSDFPAGFVQLYTLGRRTEPEQDTYAYIREYLKRPAVKLATPPLPRPPAPPTPGQPLEKLQPESRPNHAEYE
jgi:hypothetical protein